MNAEPRLPELRGELLRRAERDQHVRKALGEPSTPEQWDIVKAVDSENTPWLAEVISDHGWLCIQLVGNDGGHASLVARPARLAGAPTTMAATLEPVRQGRRRRRALLQAFPTPPAMATAGRDTLLDTVTPHAPRMAGRLVDNVLTALDEQPVVVADTSATTTIVPRSAESLRAVLEQRDAVAAQVEHLLEDHPLFRVLTSIPGVAVSDRRPTSSSKSSTSAASATAAHLASYAGLAPATRRSGSSIRSENPSKRGTNSSNEPSTSPPSPPCTTLNHTPTTSGNDPRANTTSPR